MMASVRTLPVRVAPEPGEALDSWLEAIACRNGTTLLEVMAAIGVPCDRVPLWMIYPSKPLQASITQATGITDTAITAMTLRHYNGVALEINPITGHLARSFPWGWPSRSRYCPRCLAESGGRWQLAWRLGWSFACVKHTCLLADHCPRCGARQRRLARPASLAPRPECCVTGLAATCHADLRETGVVEFSSRHPVILAQKLIYRVIENDCADFGVYRDHPCDARAALTDVRTLAVRVLAHAEGHGFARLPPEEFVTVYQRTDRLPGQHWRYRLNGRQPPVPRDAVEVAVGASTAIGILRCTSISQAGATMRWLVSKPQRKRMPDGIMWGLHSSRQLGAIQIRAYGPFMGPHLQLRYRTTDPLPLPPDTDRADAMRLATSLPTALWPAWSIRLRKQGSTDPSWRIALSCAVLLVGSCLTAKDAVDSLGGVISGTALQGLLAMLGAAPHWDNICNAATRLADYLSSNPAPIDYQRRRRLDYTQLLPETRWRQICRETGTVAGFGHKADIARCRLFETISGIPAREYRPHHGYTVNIYLRVADFPLHVTAELAACLADEGRRFLKALNIIEPLTWSPPVQLLDGLGLPNSDVDRININLLHNLANQPGSSVRRIADALATSKDTVRYLLDEQPIRIVPTSHAKNRRSFAGAAFRTVLTADTLDRLYHREQLSINDIANRFGISSSTVHRIAHGHNIELRSKPPPPDRDWLFDQYITKRRSQTQIAEELGSSPATIGSWVRKYQITGCDDDLPASRQHFDPMTARSLLRPALASTSGWNMLQHFADALRYPTLTVAAAHFGMPAATLHSQINRLEQQFRDKLLWRTPSRSTRPITATPFGLRVIEAVRALERDPSTGETSTGG